MDTIQRKMKREIAAHTSTLVSYDRKKVFQNSGPYEFLRVEMDPAALLLIYLVAIAAIVGLGFFFLSTHPEGLKDMRSVQKRFISAYHLTPDTAPPLVALNFGGSGGAIDTDAPFELVICIFSR